jgi:hypothetical protein
MDRRPPAAEAGKRFVDNDPRKPGAEPSFAPKSIETREGADIDFLKPVFGVGVIAHDAARDAVEPPVMLLDEQSHGPTVPLPCAVDELTLVPSFLKAVGLGHFDPHAPGCP